MPYRTAVCTGSITFFLVRRVSVVGNSGSGKSTLGRALAVRLAVPFVELDSFAHQPGWQMLRGWIRRD